MAKGSQGERDVSRDLSLWWTHHERDDCIWRTSGSGARFTTRAKVGLHTAGSAGDFTYIDVIAKPLFDLLLVENKVGYTDGIDPLASVDSTKLDILDTWLKKAYMECQQTHRHYPLLIFKRNRKSRCVMMPFGFFNAIAQYKTTNSPRIVLYPQKTVIMGFDEFLNWCEPGIIQLILKKATQ
jgi:hypothetical protein